MTTWHYHWVVLHEFLPLIVGQPLVDDVLRKGRRFYKPRMREGFIPVEFQAAAYRFGHSMVRPSYRANLKGDDGNPFFAMVFDPAGEGQADPVDLRGGARAPRRFIGWQTFFDFGDGEVKPNKKIDTRISTPLFDLPLGAIASHDTPQALPQRNLLRQLTWSLPSGQEIAKAMGVEKLTPGRAQGPEAVRLRQEHTALVLHPPRSRAARRRAHARRSRRPHRRRGPDRTAPKRPELIPGAKTDLDTDPHLRRIVLPNEGLPHLRRRRPGDQTLREPRPRLRRLLG